MAAFATPSVAAPPGRTAAGTTLDGDTCVTAPLENVATEPGLPPNQEIRCAGLVFGSVNYAPLIGLAAAPGDRARRDLIEKRFLDSRPFAELQQRVECSRGKWIDGAGPGGLPLLAVPCTLRDGNWLHLVLVASMGDHIAIADGGPGLLPSMLAAVNSPNSAEARDKHLATLQKIWGRPVDLVASADMARLNAALRAGRLANRMGQFADAEASFRQALNIQTSALRASEEAMSSTLLELALNVSNQGRAEEAAALFRRAAPAVQALTSDVLRARMTTYQAWDAANRADFQAALAFAREATALWRRLAEQAAARGREEGSSNLGIAEQGELANALNLRARLELRANNVTQAYTAASEAMLILNKADTLPSWWKTDSLVALGETSVAQGRLSAAETYFNAALKLRRQSYGDGPQTIQVLAALGKAYQTENVDSAAIATFREVFKLARALPSTAGVFSAEMLVPYAAAVVETAETIKDPAERQALFADAFDAFQLVQSSVVDKTIAQAAARLSTDNPVIGKLVGEMQDQQRAHDLALTKLAQEQTLPDSERSSLVENTLAAQVADAAAKSKVAKAALAAQFPNYERLALPTPVNLEVVRSALKPREGVLSFLIGRDRSFAQLITRDTVQITVIPEGESGLRDAVMRLRRSLEIEGGSINEFNLGEASKLHDMLLGRLKSTLAGVDQLIVVPTGPLSNLPFGLLVATPPTTANYAEADWLVRTKTITHAPSLQAMIALRNARPATLPRRPLLAFGDPALAGRAAARKEDVSPMSLLASNCRQGGPMPAALLEALAPLPDTTRELGVVAQTLNASSQSLFLGHRATEANLRDQTLDDYRVIYFATHGLLPGELRCQAEPGLVLTPPTAANDKRSFDGLLESSEIASLRLNADLVVLSACNTASSDNRFGGGDAMSGLAEAFFYAGARNMVVTHWQVPSAATAELMSMLFTTLAKPGGGDVSDALRRAQLTLIAQRQTAHPFFWAAFVVIGDGQSRPASVNLAGAISSPEALP
ncbi:CHAT domain-containing protein [Sphingomonas humi]|uniref:CHAT domain-containing protein n=1 Tax=Sphingomonas humi TaxID=335630 RepID=A0ABP7SEI3_9SPHN